MKNDTQEAVPRVRGDQNFKGSRYDGAINTFMAHIPIETQESQIGAQEMCNSEEAKEDEKIRPKCCLPQ